MVSDKLHGIEDTDSLNQDAEESCEEPDYYCEIHEVVEPRHKGTNDEHCPMCYEASRIEAERIQQATRDPMVEPW